MDVEDSNVGVIEDAGLALHMDRIIEHFEAWALGLELRHGIPGRALLAFAL